MPLAIAAGPRWIGQVPDHAWDNTTLDKALKDAWIISTRIGVKSVFTPVAASLSFAPGAPRLLRPRRGFNLADVGDGGNGGSFVRAS
jgi:hypothetical protein